MPMAGRCARARRPKSAAMIAMSRCAGDTSSSVQPERDRANPVDVSRSKLMVRSLLALSLLVLGSAAIAQKAPPLPGTPASIPFVDHDGIQDFEADGDHAVYLQDRSRKWYRATIMGPCLGLSYAT